MTTKAELYFSCDIEADGPIPGPYSMSSIAFCVAGFAKDSLDDFETIDPELHTFYRELKPISDRFDERAAGVSGLDRNELIAKGIDPVYAMNEAHNWVRKLADKHGARAVFVAYPLSFDWVFSHWYFVNFASKGDPFSFSSAIDIKTLYAAHTNSLIRNSTKRQMPDHLKSPRKHTHNALDDAQGQADLFANIIKHHNAWSH
jgi:hypothetical protein